MVAWSDYKSEAKSRGALALELYIVETTPAKPPEQVKAVLADHLTYQAQMELEGKLVLAGPMSDETGAEMHGMGMIVYRAKSLEAARAITEADPMHAMGVRTFVLRRWLINEGSVNISVGLSTGQVVLS